MLILGHFVFVLICLLIYAINTHVGGQRRHPSAAIAWVLLIALLPYIGLPFYLFFGSRKFVRPPRHPGAVTDGYDDTPRAAAIATLEGMGLAAPQPQRAVRFHADGHAAWNELLAVIGSAQSRLDICTYVLANDEVGQRVVRLLQDRAGAGVRVRLLLDAVGSLRTSRQQIERLRAAGVEVRWFMPLLHNPMRGRVNLRNHRKLAIADGRHVWSGGRNLAAEYFTGDGRTPPWIDLSFTVHGPLAGEALDLFESHWRHTSGPQENSRQKTAPESAGPAPGPGQHLAQMVPSGPDQAEDTVHALLLTAIYRARQRVVAVTPYFVPDDNLLTALRLAAQRGVRVELIVPARSNHRLADIARPRAMRDLAAAGAQVRLTAGMTHAKAIVVDDTLALCGSLNLDARSLFLNFELMVAFYAAEDIAAVDHWIAANFRGARRYVARAASLWRDILEGLVRWLGFQI
ncbi:phospholipase D-like domain-containing protein [Rhodoferax sediminis]|uniref:Cardiolipin synthase n=1 Tax=Rhodoferax sediminis TaxID=2509614 RepID=A0A515DER7_9BURK|nr:phospholipase D-like domain-containing protein [Rhodoferax sediminis]QDL38904.1 cardiolipin synthase [Rhodoferax sediminis]